MSSDEAIQLTNNDATTFKSYAISKGYWNDPYIAYFSSKSNLTEHKPPEMSLGYFARVNAIRSVVDKFVNKYSIDKESGLINCQIVNLGSGFDTLFFNLLDHNKTPKNYIDIDFQRIVMSKIRLIKQKIALLDKLISICFIRLLRLIDQIKVIWKLVHR